MIELALVTGASSGIGKELCRLLARQGINLIISGRNIVELQALSDELSLLVPVIIAPADIANIQDRLGLVELIHKRMPDLVINNAGFGLYGDALSHRIRDTMEILEVDGNATIQLTLEAARTLIDAKKRGIILNVASVAGYFEIFPCLAMYAAAKAMVAQFSQSLDDEIERHGVRVLTACPGMVNTGFRDRAAGKHLEEKVFGTMDAIFAAEQIWKQIQSGKAVNIFDWKYKVAVFCARYLVPRRWVAKILKRGINKRLADKG